MAEKTGHFVDLVALVLGELRERHWFLFTCGQGDKVGLIVILLSPDPHEFESSLTANAEILGHEHACHHDVVLPLFVWLDAFVVVIAPGDWLVEDLLDAKSSHFVFVFKDVVHN